MRVYALNHIPAYPSQLEVVANGAILPRDTYSYEAGAVTFGAAICNQVRRADPSNPMHLEFKIYWTR